MDRRKYNKGTIGNNGGRKPKADEQKLIERLTPLEEPAYDALRNAIKEEESWAVKLFFEYMYGKPRQQIEQTNIDGGVKINALFKEDILNVPSDNSTKENS